MCVHGLRGERELGGDLSIGAPLGHPPEHQPLARGEALPLVVLGLGTAGEAALGGGIEEATPRGHRAERGDEVLDARTLHHVAQGSGPQRLAHRRPLLVHGEDADPRARSLRAQPGEDRPTLPRERPVEEQHLRSVLDHRGEGALRVGCLGHQRQVGLGGQHGAHPGADDRVIVGDDDVDHALTPPSGMRTRR